MAVPDTTTFTLQDVQAEVDPSKNNLNDLITVANAQSPSKWDPDYEGSKNSLLNFRNYGATPAYTQFQMTTTKYYGTGNVNCSDSNMTTYYHNGAGNEPAVGDIIYEDSSGTTVHNGIFFGVGAWRKTSSGFDVIQVSSTGEVLANSPMCQF